MELPDLVESNQYLPLTACSPSLALTSPHNNQAAREWNRGALELSDVISLEFGIKILKNSVEAALTAVLTKYPSFSNTYLSL